MTDIAAKTAALSEQLSDEGAKELLEYARRLVEKEDDDEWDRLVEKSTKSPKFAEFLRNAEREIAAGLAEPMDESKL